MGPSCGCWVWSIGRQAGPWVPRVVRMSVSAKKTPHQGLHLLQERGPLPGLETGLLSNTRKWIVWEDIYVDKARDFIGKGRPGREQEGKGTQNCSATWLAVLGFMVMGLVSRLSLVNHSDSESFLVVQALFSQDGRQREGFWEVVGQMVSPFDLSWTLLVGGGLLVPCSLPGPPVIKQLMQMVTMVPGQGWAVSISVIPLTLWSCLMVHPGEAGGRWAPVLAFTSNLLFTFPE